MREGKRHNKNDRIDPGNLRKTENTRKMEKH